MSEIITNSTLAILLIGMFVYHVFMVKELNKQIRELVKIQKAKNLTEYSASEKIQENTTEQEPPEFIPSENIDEDIFNKMIERQLDGSR